MSGFEVTDEDFRWQGQPVAVLVDERSEAAFCEECGGQLYSAHWSARHSKALHERGTGHTVRLINAAEAVST